jgi:hypothetical protein
MGRKDGPTPSGEAKGIRFRMRDAVVWDVHESASDEEEVGARVGQALLIVRDRVEVL